MSGPQIFSPETLGFLRDLQANNARDWFNDNKARYEAAWKAPAEAFIKAMFRREGSKAGLFFGLQTDRLVLGAGMMGFDKGQLAAYREAVAGSAGENLQAALAALLSQNGRMNAPDLARVPKPYDKEHERGDLLRRKSLTIWRDYDDPSRVERGDLIDVCVMIRSHQTLQASDCDGDRTLF